MAKDGELLSGYSQTKQPSLVLERVDFGLLTPAPLDDLGSGARSPNPRWISYQRCSTDVIVVVAVPSWKEPPLLSRLVTSELFAPVRRVVHPL